MINGLTVSTPEISFSRQGFNIRPFTELEGCTINLQHTFSGEINAWLEYDASIRILVYSGHQQFLIFDGRRKSSTYGAMQELWSGIRKPLLLDIPSGVIIGWRSIEAGDILLQLPESASLKQHPANTHLIPFSWDEPLHS